LEIVGKDDERLAWVSGVEYGSTLEIEELFVRPSYRGRGHGTRLMGTMYNVAKDRRLSFRLWISYADIATDNLRVIEAMAKPAGLSIQASGVRWAPLVLSPASAHPTAPAVSVPYDEKPPSIFPGLAMYVSGLLSGAGTNLASNVIYDAIKSWFDPKGGRRIRAKLGGLEVETSEISPEEFVKLLKELQQVKEEAEIRAKILDAGITLRIINQ